MIFWQKSKKTLTEQDAALAHLLTRNDPIAPPSQSYLSSLEDQILAELAIQPQRRKQSQPLHPFAWFPAGDWILRGAVAGAVLVLLGFVVGQELQSIDPENETALFSVSDSSPFTSLIHSPLTAGDADDADE